MIGRHTQTGMGTGGGRGLWPVLLLLLAVVLVPTACVLWFMNAAMTNERLAVRQKLTDVYRQKVEVDQAEIRASWPQGRMSYDGKWVEVSRGAQLRSFRTLAGSGRVASVIMLDESGKVAFPDLTAPQATQPSASSEDWEEARRLEFERQDFEKAAEAYARAAGREADQHDFRAQALVGQARCLVRSGKKDQGLAILLDGMSKPGVLLARDQYLRSIWLDAQLYALSVMDRGDERFEARARLLSALLVGGAGAAIEKGLAGVEAVMDTVPASQLIAAMEMLDSLGVKDMPLGPGTASSRILPAVELAAEYLQSAPPPPETLRVTPTSLPGIWQMGSRDGRMILLFKEDRLVAELKAACKLDEPFAGITTRLELPGRRSPGNDPFLAVPVSEYFPGWQLAVYLVDDPFADALGKRNSYYLLVGASAIAFITLLAAVMASYLGRQIRLTRLKNDLIATVSHELKTPLASMRVLVDTLREGRCPDPRQAGEYLDLIAKENERLSRLIDNFLTFSRMERNKRAFEFAPVDMGEVVQAAVSAVHDRFASPESRLEVDAPDNTLHVRADRDALVTVLLNLLDNAWKYSGDNKAVKVRAFAADGSVFIEVSDNGVGMSRRAQRRIFDKFYQVDQTLSRRAGGCGLGLSIVKFILDAHGGTISVRSQPGKGSTFTVQLPATDGPPAAQATG